MNLLYVNFSRVFKEEFLIYMYNRRPGIGQQTHQSCGPHIPEQSSRQTNPQWLIWLFFAIIVIVLLLLLLFSRNSSKAAPSVVK